MTSDAEPDAHSVEEEEKHSTQEENEQILDEHSDNETCITQGLVDDPFHLQDMMTFCV